MKLLPQSFQNRLALLFGGLALMVGLPTAFYVNQVYSTQLVNDRGRSLQDLAGTVAAVLSENLRERQREMEYLAELPLFREGAFEDKTFGPILAGLQKSHPYYTWIGFADGAGTVRAATRDLLVGVNVSQRPWFIHGRERSFVGDLHEALLLAKHIPAVPGVGPVRFIDFAAPVLGADGQVRGVVAAHAHWSWARQVMETIKPRHAGDSRLEILIVNEKNQVTYPEDFNPKVLAPLIPAGGRGFTLDSWQSDREFLTADAPLKEVIPANPLGWRVVVRQPRDEALKDVAHLQKILILAALAAAGVFLALAWWSASRVSRPLGRLALVARRIEQGEENARLDVGARSSELVALVDALGGMASTLIQRKNALAESNAVLEVRVQERTADLERVNRELQALARRDALTGIPNRLAAGERLRAEYLRMKRSGVAYAVLLLDIDFFKRINDTHGHAVGDRVLQHVARVLAFSLRETDLAARFGGEEFLVLLPATDLADAARVGEKIRGNVEASPPAEVDRVTVSIGVAAADPGQADEDEAVRQADHWLYAAKGAGRNRVAGAEPAPIAG